MRVSFWRRFRPGDERGVTAVLMAIWLVLLVGLTALVVDLGRGWVERRREVRATDAAALAAALSFAVEEAQCVQDDPSRWIPAQTSADRVALANVSAPSPAERVLFSPDCANRTVTVAYRSQVTYAFAPLFGFPRQRMVSARATARWGPSGAAYTAPLMLRDAWMTQVCQWFDSGPQDFPQEGEECAIWMNNDAQRPENLGNAMWGWVNLCYLNNGCPSSKRGWDVRADANCPDVGTSDLRDWIANGSREPLPVRAYACTATGNVNSAKDSLRERQGDIIHFPVNCAQPGSWACPTGGNPPYGQVDKNGNPCPPSALCTPDKYDMVGYVPLEVTWVLDGNDRSTTDGTPAAVGPGGKCSGQAPRSDPNALCLVLTWRGPQSGGGYPFPGPGGADFGSRGVQLID
jgi:hypothetical protein